jgi:hypothetical protein
LRHNGQGLKATEKRRPAEGRFFCVQVSLGLVEYDLRHGKIPEGVQDLKTVLFFALEGGESERLPGSKKCFEFACAKIRR